MLAQLILFFIGLLTLFVSALGMRDAREEVVYLLDVAPSQVDPGGKAADGELREELLKEMTGRIRLVYGVNLGLGVLYVACALLVHRIPVIATVTGLTLYLGSLAMIASVDPAFLARGILFRILIIIALIAAVTSAIRTERRRNARRRRYAEDEGEASDVG